jgi:hypothetical protein
LWHSVISLSLAHKVELCGLPKRVYRFIYIFILFLYCSTAIIRTILLPRIIIILICIHIFHFYIILVIENLTEAVRQTIIKMSATRRVVNFVKLARLGFDEKAYNSSNSYSRNVRTSIHRAAVHR